MAKKIQPEPHKCEYCGKTFTPKSNYANKARYCSKSCYSKAFRAKWGYSKLGNTNGHGVKWRKKPKTYAEIRRHNKTHPIASGWRGQMVAGGGAKVVA